jgi:hypothetical protein
MQGMASSVLDLNSGFIPRASRCLVCIVGVQPDGMGKRGIHGHPEP